MPAYKIKDIKIYVISLRSASERRRSIQAEFERCNLPSPTIVDAYDGHDSEFPFSAYRHLFKGFWKGGEGFKPGAFTCYLSHSVCWEKINDSAAPCSLVLEDDALLLDNAISSFSINDNVLAEGLDVLFVNDRMYRWINQLFEAGQQLARPELFSGSVKQSKYCALAGEDLISVPWLLVRLIESGIFADKIPAPGGDGYIVTPGGAAKLLDVMKHMGICMGVDYAMVFNSLDKEDLSNISRLAKLPSLLIWCLGKRMKAFQEWDPLISYVYSKAPLVTTAGFPSTLKHKVRRQTSAFHIKNIS